MRDATIPTGKRCALESFEPRVLLAALTDFLGAEVSRAGAEHLHYLAAHVKSAELAKLDLLQGQLRDLLGRQLQTLHENGRSLPLDLSLVKFNGVAWTDQHVADGAQPHVQVYVRDVDESREALSQLGLQITSVVDDENWQVVAGFLPVPLLRKLVQVPGVRAVMPSERPTADVQGAAANQWETTSGADQLRRIKLANTGAGVDIGVISDSINRVGAGLAGSKASGDLPMNVVTLADGPAGTTVIDEGRAMLELIYDVAPGAALYFHAGGDATATADAYTALKDAGVDVIADDLAYFTEPVFQQGVLSQRAEDMSVNHDVLVFGSAGNRNNETYASTWTNADADRYHEFGAGDSSLNITVPGTAAVMGGGVFNAVLHWDQPWMGATTDIDIELWNATGTTLIARSNIANAPMGNPVETLSFTNTSVNPVSYQARFVVDTGGDDGSDANGLHLQAYFRGASTYFTENYTQNNPGINPNRNSDFTFAIGAANHATPGVTESFSSRGPITRYFADDGSVLAAPITKQQPLFYAADGVATTFPANSELNPFFGTSAATPNAAAIAALALDAAGNTGRGDLTYAEVFELFRITATDLNAGAVDWSASAGFGQVNGLAAPLAAAGRPGGVAVELNQFGNYTASADISGNTNVDTYLWSSNSPGSSVVEAALPGAALFPALLLWNASFDQLLGYDYMSGPAGGSRKIFSADAGAVYQSDVFSRSAVTGGGDYSYTAKVDAPDQLFSTPSLDIRGDVTINDVLATASDVKYIRVDAPPGALGALSVQLTPSAGYDGVVSIFNVSGAEVARSNTGSAGSVEFINISSDIAPGAQFFIRVGSSGYQSSGSFSLAINFTAIPGGLPLTWTAPVAGVMVPDRFGLFEEADGNVFPAAVIGAPGERGSWYVGLNSLNGAALVQIRADVDAPSPVRPIVALYTDSGTFVASSPAGNFAHTSVDIQGTPGTRYIAVVVDEEGNRVGDARVSGGVGFMTAVSTRILLNPEGDGSAAFSTLPGGGELLRYRFVLPGGANGTGVITVDGGDDDIEAWLFQDETQVVAFSRSAGPGNPEVMHLTGIGVGGTYHLVVLPQNYAAAVDSGTVSIDFEAITGTATGVKFRDDDRDGERDPGEPGLEGFRIYNDENFNGVFDPLEDSVLTAADGTYTLTGLIIPTGPEFARIREVQQPGYTQTAPASGRHDLFINVNAPVVNGVDFGNYRQLDFGDAPASCKTTLADDGPRHWLLPGFTLGNTWDGELDGQPSALATGDGTDEDGVSVVGAIVAGSMASFTVTAPGGGVLDGWIDFNRNGAFTDAADRVVTSFLLASGANTISVPVPAGLADGELFARFRLSETGVTTAFGFAGVGEVEDYRFVAGAIPPPPSAPDLVSSSDSGASNSDNITNDISPTFSGSAAPGVVVHLYRNGVEVAAAPTPTGSWTLTDPGPVPPGSHAYTARAEVGGLFSAASPATSITIDVTPPGVVASMFNFEFTHELTVGFSEFVAPSLSPGDFGVTHAMFGMVPDFVKMLTYEPMGNIGIVRFPGSSTPNSGPGTLPDGNYTLTIAATAVRDLAGNPLAVPLTMPFFVFAADTNRDRAVNIGDFSIVAARFNLPGMFSQGDFNYDGVTNIGDFAILAAKFNTSLPAAGDVPRAANTVDGRPAATSVLPSNAGRTGAAESKRRSIFAELHLEEIAPAAAR